LKFSIYPPLPDATASLLSVKICSDWWFDYTNY